VSFDELAQLIAMMTPADRARPVLVYPPVDCPAQSLVAVVNLDQTTQGVPFLSLGKTPNP
jgi:hypothetical protein